MAPNRDAELAHIADELAGVFDFLVAVGQAQLGLVERRAALDDIEVETAVVEGGFHAHQIGVAPRVLVGMELGRVLGVVEAADHVVDAALLDHLPQG